MAQSLLGQLQLLLQQAVVWFFGIFSRIAAVYDDSNTPKKFCYRNVVIINTRQHWDTVFQESEGEGKEGILAYFTKWSSPPCKFVRPWYAELSARYPQVKFLTVYVEDLEELAVEAGVQFVPEFQLFHRGQMEKVKGAKQSEVEALLRKKFGDPVALQALPALDNAKQTRSKKAD